MVFSDVQKNYDLNKIKKDLLDYFKKDKFEIEFFDTITNSENKIEIDLNEEIHLINFMTNLSLNKHIVVIPYILNIIIGDDIEFDHGTFFGEKVRFSLEYNSNNELISVSW